MSSEFERRRHARKSVYTDIQGEFQANIDGKNYPVLNIKDVSISGIGLSLPLNAEPDTEIRLTFSAEDLKLAIKGRVAWTTESENPTPDIAVECAYMVGVEFDPANGDHNCLLFMALRKYLDDFE